MNGFMESIPTQKLFDMMKQAEDGHLEASEALIRSELNRRLSQVALDATGAYDASQDAYTTTEHPEDERWIVRGRE